MHVPIVLFLHTGEIKNLYMLSKANREPVSKTVAQLISLETLKQQDKLAQRVTALRNLSTSFKDYSVSQATEILKKVSRFDENDVKYLEDQ